MKSFQEINQDNNTLLIVDSLNLAFRYKHSGATDFAEDYLRTVNSLKKSYKASHVIIACDQGSSTYRKALYPEYKQNRKDKQAEQTDAENAAFELFFEDFLATLEHIKTNTNYPVIKFQGVEADDIAAYIVSKKKTSLKKKQEIKKKIPIIEKIVKKITKSTTKTITKPITKSTTKTIKGTKRGQETITRTESNNYLNCSNELMEEEYIQ